MSEPLRVPLQCPECGAVDSLHSMYAGPVYKPDLRSYECSKCERIFHWRKIESFNRRRLIAGARVKLPPPDRTKDRLQLVYIPEHVPLVPVGERSPIGPRYHTIVFSKQEYTAKDKDGSISTWFEWEIDSGGFFLIARPGE